VKCTWDILTGRVSESSASIPASPGTETLRRSASTATMRSPFISIAFLTLLASGYSPIYPCHVPPRDMRQHPIGTGPFKFVGFKPNEYIKVTRNLGYWKEGRPYLDGIEYTIIRNLSTAILAFVAGKFDMTFAYSVTEPLLKDVNSQMP